jgi:hypothetical protein
MKNSYNLLQRHLGQNVCPDLYFVVLNYQWVSGVMVMVFNATFHNISVISWRLALLVRETGIKRENNDL